MCFTAATVSSYIDGAVPEKAAVRSAEDIVNATKTESPLALIVPAGKRDPAAVQSQKTEVLKADLFCENKERARFKKVSQTLLMLNLNVCTELKSSRHIWIKNVTNGFKAQVFKTGAKDYRTDFIQLSSGNNKLLIEAVLKDGQKRTHSLEIISGS